MEIIIFVAVVVGIALVWSNYLKKEKSKTDNAIDSWEPSKILNSKDEPWPYGENVAEGKIHVKTTDVAPGKSADDRVEAPAPVVEPAPAKKTAAKPAAAKKPAVKKAPAKKSST